MKMKKNLTLMFCIVGIIMLAGQYAWPVQATIGNVKVTKDYTHEGQKGLYVEMFDVSVSGMNGKQVHFAAAIQQNGQFIQGLQAAHQPVNVDADPWTVTGKAAWFFFAYECIEKAANVRQPIWVSVFVVNSDNAHDHFQKDMSVTLSLQKHDRSRRRSEKSDSVDKDCMTACMEKNAAAQVAAEVIEEGCKSQCAKK